MKRPRYILANVQIPASLALIAVVLFVTAVVTAGRLPAWAGLPIIGISFVLGVHYTRRLSWWHAHCVKCRRCSRMEGIPEWHGLQHSREILRRYGWMIGQDERVLCRSCYFDEVCPTRSTADLN